MQSINKHSELEAIAHLELDEIRTENQTLKESLKKEQKEKNGLEDELNIQHAAWKEEVLSGDCDSYK